MSDKNIRPERNKDLICPKCLSGVETSPVRDNGMEAEVAMYDVKIECKSCGYSTYRPVEVEQE